MRAIFILILLSIFFSDLNAQIEFYECPKEKRYNYVTDAKLIPKYLLGKDSTSFRLKVDTGHSIVLKYEQKYDCSGTHHLGVIASLFWSIPQTSTKFKIDFDNIDSPQTAMVYVTACGPPCRSYNFEMISAKGNIQGALKDKTWQVNGKIEMLLYNKELNVTVSKDLIIDGTYVLWKQNRKEKKGYKFNGFG